MKSIDFLPQKYHEQHARHRAGLWRLVVVALLGGVVAASSLGQMFHRRSVQTQLDSLAPMYAEAQAKQTALAQMHSELNQETAAATLYAYLQTPWPRTQIVAAISLPVSEGVRIEQLHIIESETPTTAAPTMEVASTPPALETMSAATRDLTMIRTAGATRTTQAEITGTCHQAADVHEYLGQVEKSPLVARAELVSLENVTIEGRARELRFTAQVKLHPARGWGSCCATVLPATTPTATLTQLP